MLRSLKSIRGFTLAATDGELGKVREVYFDDHSWTIRYLIVETGGWFTGKDVLIAPRSLGLINEQDGTLEVNLTQDQIRNSPPIESDRPVSRQYEEAYYSYYGWEPYWAAPGGTPAFWAPAPPAVSEPEGYETSRMAAGESRSSEAAEDERKGDPHLRSSAEVTGYAIHASDGHIGHLEDLVIDDEDWRVRYLILDTRTWLPGKQVIISPDWINLISFAQGEIVVNATREEIKEAPEYDSNQPVSRALEGRLYESPGYKANWEGIHAARLRR